MVMQCPSTQYPRKAMFGEIRNLCGYVDELCKKEQQSVFHWLSEGTYHSNVKKQRIRQTKLKHFLFCQHVN